MAAHFRQPAHRVEKTSIDVTGVRARKPDALDTRDLVDGLDEPREVAPRVVWSLVVIHDLAQQLDLPTAARNRLANFGENIGLRTHPFVSAGIRDDAKAAEVVATLDDGHIRLDRIAPPRHTPRKRHVVLR